MAHVTFLAASRYDRIEVSLLIDGPIHGIKACAYAEQALMPLLQPHDIVIIDKLGDHKDTPSGRPLERLARTSFSRRPVRLISIQSSRFCHGQNGTKQRRSENQCLAITQTLKTVT